MKLTQKHLRLSDAESYAYILDSAKSFENLKHHISKPSFSGQLEIFPGLLSGSLEHVGLMNKLMVEMNYLTNEEWDLNGCVSAHFQHTTTFLNTPGFLPNIMGSTPLPSHIPNPTLTPEDKTLIDEIVLDIFSGWTHRSVVMPVESSVGGFDMISGKGARESLMMYALSDDIIDQFFDLIRTWDKKGNEHIFYDLSQLMRGCFVNSTWRRQTNEKNGTLKKIEPKMRPIIDYLGDFETMDRSIPKHLLKKFPQLKERYGNRTRINQGYGFLVNFGEMLIARFVSGYDSNAYAWSKTNSLKALWYKNQVMRFSCGTDQTDQDKNVFSYIMESIVNNSPCLTDDARSYLKLMTMIPQIKVTDHTNGIADFSIVGSFFKSEPSKHWLRWWRGENIWQRTISFYRRLELIFYC